MKSCVSCSFDAIWPCDVQCSSPSTFLVRMRTKVVLSKQQLRHWDISLSKRAHVSHIKTCVFMLIHHPYYAISDQSHRLRIFHHTLPSSNRSPSIHHLRRKSNQHECMYIIFLLSPRTLNHTHTHTILGKVNYIIFASWGLFWGGGRGGWLYVY